MIWACLNGRISVEMMKHEHPLEYERMGDDKKDTRRDSGD